MEHVLTVAEYARARRVHPNTIYLMIEREEIPHLRLGGAIRLNPEMVDKVLFRGGTDRIEKTEA